MSSSTHRQGVSEAALLMGILLIAANLRAPFTGLPPLLGAIQADFGLSTLATGALTTLPLLAFALLSPVSVGISAHRDRRIRHRDRPFRSIVTAPFGAT